MKTTTNECLRRAIRQYNRAEGGARRKSHVETAAETTTDDYQALCRAVRQYNRATEPAR